MATLNIAQMIGYAKGAGFTGEDATIAGAVGMAESSGRTDVVNFLGCVGIWQIYVGVHRAEIKRRWPNLDPTTAMKDPAKNAEMAYWLWKQSKWRPWEGYTNGMYLKYMPQARKDAGAEGITADGSRAANAGLTDVADGLGALTNPATWLRVLYTIIGIALIGLAIARFTQVDNVVSKAAKIAITKKV